MSDSEQARFAARSPIGHVDCYHSFRLTQTAVECFQFRPVLLPGNWLLKTPDSVPVIRDSITGSRLSHTQTLSHNSQWDPSMLRNPHVATERSTVMDRVLSERNLPDFDLLSGCLIASEAGPATSVEKAFVNLQFNDLSTSAHAGDSVFSRGFLTSMPSC